MKCTNCGEQVLSGSKFCANCGAAATAVPPISKTQAESWREIGGLLLILLLAWLGWTALPIISDNLGVDVSTFPPLLQVIVYGGLIFLLVVFLAAAKVLFRK